MNIRLIINGIVWTYAKKILFKNRRISILSFCDSPNLDLDQERNQSINLGFKDLTIKNLDISESSRSIIIFYL